MTHKKGIDEFKRLMNGMDRKLDVPMIREAYSHWIDISHQNGEITDRQAHNWCLPHTIRLHGKMWPVGGGKK